MNNPLKFIDPDGENPLIAAFIVVAIIGGYTGYKIGEAYDAKGWDMVAYVASGAIVGGFSGLLGAHIAATGGIMGNTLGLVMGSALNSSYNNLLTKKSMAPTINFGVASYDFTDKEWGYLGKEGNSALEDIGYGLGAMTNLQDIYATFNQPNNNDAFGEIEVNARKKVAGHSWIKGKNINISVGPAVDDKPNADGVLWELQYYKTVKGINFITRYDPKKIFTTKLNNVNITKLQSMTNFLNDGLSLSGKHSLKYGIWNGCVNQTSRALLKAGVLNFNAFLPITFPALLNAELVLKNFGIINNPLIYSYYMTTYK